MVEGFLRSCRWTAPGAVGHPSTLLASPPAPPHVRCALTIPLPDIIHRFAGCSPRACSQRGSQLRWQSLCVTASQPTPIRRCAARHAPQISDQAVARAEALPAGLLWLLASPTHTPIATTMVRHSHRRSPPRRPLTRVSPCGALHCGASGSGGVSCRRGKGVDRTWACWPRSRLAQHHLAPAG